MINKLRTIYKSLYLKRLKKRGLKIGANFQFEKGGNIDAAFPWLIEIGNNVTFSSWVYIVAHDGASQKHIGYSRVGRVVIGNNVFIGVRSIVMPGVTIGDNSIIGANSVVTTSIPSGKVAVGSPAKVIMDIDEYIKKNKTKMKNSPVYEREYTLSGNISAEKKKQMKAELKDEIGYII